MTTLSVIVFDLGRVLVDLDFDAFPRLLGFERSHASPSAKSSIERLAIQYETGKITTELFFNSLDDILHHKFRREELLNAWNAIIGEENSAIAPIVDAVQLHYRTAILSNTSPTHFQKALDTLPTLRKFSKRYLSYEIGAMKPDLAVYRHVIENLNVDPSTILFIDDISENIIAAQQCGMVGVLFTDPLRLRGELESRSIL
jgi:HAD superfamily hydrolase (TIGR01509 family)